MRLEQHVGRDRRLHLVGPQLREARLRMLADVRIGPAVERALLHAGEIVRHQIVAEPVALLHHGVEIAGVGIEGERRRIAHAGRVGGLVAAVGIEALDRGLHLGLDADVAGGADADEQPAGLRIDRELAVGVALTMPNTPFLVSIFSPTSDGDGLRCSGGTSAAFVSAGARAGAHRADPVRHLPDAVLVGDQHLAVAPGEAVGPVQALDVALDPVGLAVAVLVAQQRDVADLLLGHQHVAVRQHQQAGADVRGRWRTRSR